MPLTSLCTFTLTGSIPSELDTLTQLHGLQLATATKLRRDRTSEIKGISV